MGNKIENKTDNNIIDSAFKKDGKVINLHSQGIQDADFIYLLTKKTPKVIRLDVQQNNLSSISMFRIREANWKSLTQLWLSKNKIGNMGCKYLSRLGFLQLHDISLSCNQISSVGVFHLTKAEWKNLQNISFQGNRIGFDGVKRLFSAKWNKQLNYIGFSFNELLVGQVYQLILCDYDENKIGIKVWQNKIEYCYSCYQGNLKRTLKQKNLSVKFQDYW